MTTKKRKAKKFEQILTKKNKFWMAYEAFQVGMAQ